MASDNYGYSVGLRNVGSYQISGHPYITGSRMETDDEIFVGFPSVARGFTVINSGSQAGEGTVGPILRIHFNSSADGNVTTDAGRHYITLESDDQSITFHTKCTGVFITCVGNGGGDGGFEVLANLTGIMDTNMYALTGSGLTD